MSSRALRTFVLVLVLVSCTGGPALAAGAAESLQNSVRATFSNTHFDRESLANEALSAVKSKGTTEVIVTLAQPDQVSQTVGMSRAEQLGEFHARNHAMAGDVLARLSAGEFRERNRFDNFAGFIGTVSERGLRQLLADPSVEFVEPIRILEAHLAQGIPLMNAAVVRSSYNGSGLSIAVCDTGVDYTHPRLGNGGFPNSKVLGGNDYGDNDADPLPNTQAHGTCCAGIAAGDLGTVGDYIGGMAYSAKLYALKISSGTSGSATNAAMISAWDWCVTHQNDNPSYPIMVISTSFGGGRYYSTASGDAVSPSMTTAANNAVAAGITVLASSGNDGYCDSVAWPACISSVISVGAVYDAGFGTYYPCVNSATCAAKTADSGCSTGYYSTDTTAADKVTSYSNTASFLTLLAPSNACATLDIVGAAGYSANDYYTSFGGTSAACPYAAGAVACLQSAAKSITGHYLTPAEVRSTLTSTGANVTDTKVAITKPRINLGAAVAALVPDTTPPTVSSVTSNLANGTYTTGQVVDVRVTFTEAVTYVPGTGLAQLQLETGTTDRKAVYAGGSGGTVLVFNYTVQSGDVSADLEYLSTAALTLTGTATIKDAAGNNATLTLPTPGSATSLGGSKAIVIDAVAPTVSNVTSNLANGAYTTGQVVDLRVTFSKAVTYVPGTGLARVQLETGTTDRQAAYASGSGGTVLVFNYTVQAGDTSADLEYLGTGALTLTGTATIKDSAGNSASLMLPTLGSANSLGGSKAIAIDTTAPVITLNGLAILTVECRTPYTDAGATASDNMAGDLTGSIVVVNPVNMSVVGVYTVRYNVKDTANNNAPEVTRTVNVVDTTPPFITLNGLAAVTVECRTSYADAGATATDSCAGDRTAGITVTNPVNTAVPGAYTIRYNVNDGNGNSAVEVTRTVDVLDTVPPVVTLNGLAAVTVECKTAYADAGATATDSCAGDRTAQIVVTNPVNTAAPGSHTVRYNVNDGNGNSAAEVTRTVNVADTIRPVITLLGSNPAQVECGGVYTDAGAIAGDSCAGDRIAAIVVTNPVNTAVPGAYTVRYNVSDGNENTAIELTRTVYVVDTTPPTISLMGSNPTTVQCGSAYTDAGATASDTCVGDRTANIAVDNLVNTALPGTYPVRYNVNDGNGNNAAEVTRLVTVSDTTAPTIQLTGAPEVTVECGGTYTELGATATDNCAPSPAVTIGGDAVNTAATGVYTVTYNASDGNGNGAVQTARTVTVMDTTPPVISLVGAAAVTVPYGGTYTELGATATDNCAANLGVTVGGAAVNTAVLGAYTVRYNANDGNGNHAAEITRTVTVVDNSSPTGTIVINNNRSATNTPNVTLALTWNDGAGAGVVRMRFSDDGANWTAWEPLAATRAYILPAGDTHKTVRVQYLDRANNRSAAFSDYILLDTTPPTGSIVINNGASTTTTRAVTLGLAWADGTGSGVSRMRFSNDGAHWTAWLLPKPSYAYTLTGPTGYNTVRAQFLDGANNYSPVYSDYIKLLAP